MHIELPPHLEDVRSDFDNAYRSDDPRGAIEGVGRFVATLACELEAASILHGEAQKVMRDFFESRGGATTTFFGPVMKKTQEENARRDHKEPQLARVVIFDMIHDLGDDAKIARERHGYAQGRLGMAEMRPRMDEESEPYMRAVLFDFYDAHYCDQLDDGNRAQELFDTLGKEAVAMGMLRDEAYYRMREPFSGDDTNLLEDAWRKCNDEQRRATQRWHYAAQLFYRSLSENWNYGDGKSSGS